MKNCNNCGAPIPSWRKYCSLPCYYKTITGRKLSEEHRKKLCEHRKRIPDKETLIQLYEKERQPVGIIATMFSLSDHTVYSLVKEYGIGIRKRPCLKGAAHHAWKGGVHYSNGYRMIYLGNGKQRPEHTLMAEKALGRRLKKTECVHHIDGSRDNNRNDNLLICDNSYHAWLHTKITPGFLGQNKATI